MSVALSPKTRFLLLRSGRTGSEGFTLIELLVVAVIVGILAGVSIPTFLNQVRRARIAEAQAGLTAVTRGSEIYRLTEGVYPDDFNLIEEGGLNGNLYMDQQFSELAPNYQDPLPNFSSDDGVLWVTIARPTATAYVNGAGAPLRCEAGLGTQVALTTVDENCNL